MLPGSNSSDEPQGDHAYLSDDIEAAAANAVVAALEFKTKWLDARPPVFIAQHHKKLRLVALIVVPAGQESRWETRAGAALIALREVVPLTHEVSVQRYETGVPIQ